MTPDEILRQARAESLCLSLAIEGNDLLVDWDGEPPSESLLDALRRAKPEIIARLQRERGRINRWIADRLVDGQLETCSQCRQRIVAGQAFADVSNGEARARFHKDCHREWLAGMEAKARAALGLGA